MSSSYDKFLSSLITPIGNNCHPPLFIAGSGRNGSTLISSILNNHENIFIPPENSIIPFAIKYWLLHPLASWEAKLDVIFKELDKPSMWSLDVIKVKSKLQACSLGERNINFLIHSIYFEYAKVHKHSNNIIWGDKTPSNTVYLHIMKKQFENSKVVFLLRDPRAVMSSLLEADYSYYIKRIDHMIWRWKNSLRKYNEINRKYPNEIWLLKYEDFVVDPGKMTIQLVDWLGLQCDETLIRGKDRNMELLGVSDAMHHQNIRNEISVGSIDKWKTKLDLKCKLHVENSLKHEMRALNYM